MAGENYLDEYLIRLGFKSDATGFAQFEGMLRSASSLVDSQYTRMMKTVLEFEGASLGAFGSIGAAALGFADKIAGADQDYRLLALHMYTSLPVARELKIALDALGQPLENVMWDPELAGRFQQLVKDQRLLTEDLGAGFENQMRRIRDLRFEFTRLGVEGEYLLMQTVEDLAEAFGTNLDGVLNKFREFNSWFIQNMPSIARWISGNLTPILIDVKDVMGETLQTGKQLAITFQNVMAAISGDKSLEGQVFSWDKLGKSIDFASHDIERFTIATLHAIELSAHLVSAIADVTQGDWKDARIELEAAKHLLTPGSGTVLGGVTGSTAGTVIGGAMGVPGGPFGVIGGAAIGNMLGAGIGAGLGHELGESFNPDQKRIQRYVASMAKALRVDPALALAVAQQESDFRQFDKNGKLLTSSAGALGVMQLMPRTARMLGVDPSDTVGNIQGGVMYLSQLLSKYNGDAAKALDIYSGHTQGYPAQVLRREAGIHVDGGLNVSVTVSQPNATAPEISREVVKSLKEFLRKDDHKTQRTIAEFAQPGFSY